MVVICDKCGMWKGDRHRNYHDQRETGGSWQESSVQGRICLQRVFREQKREQGVGIDCVSLHRALQTLT